ncbi:hypothetical protein ACHAXT_012385 [Thalassiosira profunda]
MNGLLLISSAALALLASAVALEPGSTQLDGNQRGRHRFCGDRCLRTDHTYSSCDADERPDPSCEESWERSHSSTRDRAPHAWCAIHHKCSWSCPDENGSSIHQKSSEDATLEGERELIEKDPIAAIQAPTASPPKRTVDDADSYGDRKLWAAIESCDKNARPSPDCREEWQDEQLCNGTRPGLPRCNVISRCTWKCPAEKKERPGEKTKMSCKKPINKLARMSHREACDEMGDHNVPYTCRNKGRVCCTDSDVDISGRDDMWGGCIRVDEFMFDA